MRTIDQKLSAIGACSDAVEWTRSLGRVPAREAWAKCKRGDWMLWLLGKLSGPPHSVSRRKLVACALECAETATHNAAAANANAAAAAAAAANAAAAAFTNALATCADIVRKRYSKPPRLP